MEVYLSVISKEVPRIEVSRPLLYLIGKNYRILTFSKKRLPQIVFKKTFELIGEKCCLTKKLALAKLYTS